MKGNQFSFSVAQPPSCRKKEAGSNHNKTCTFGIRYVWESQPFQRASDLTNEGFFTYPESRQQAESETQT